MDGINGWVRAWLRRNWVENQAAEAVSLLLTSCTGFLYKVDMLNFVTALLRVSIFRGKMFMKQQVLDTRYHHQRAKINQTQFN